jgi:PAS domain S-box-containing protein
VIEGRIAMSATLESLLHDLESEILDRWEARLAAAIPKSPENQANDSPLHTRDELRDALGAVGRRTASAAVGLAVVMARLELRRPGARRNVADTALALLVGREATREVLSEHVDPSELARFVKDLDEGFNQAVWIYGQTTCAMCLARGEESRERIERQLQSVMERSEDAIVLCDLEGHVEHWNPGAQALFGWTRGEIRGKTLDGLRAPGTRARTGSLLAELTLQGHVRDPEIEMVRKDGTPVWVDGSYTLVRDGEQRPIAIGAVFRDMTERRKIAEDKLQADRLALVGTMSARFAHEIRNPLASILINLDLIRDSLKGRETDEPGSTGDDDETISAIASEVGRIHKVVQDYLHFGRMPQLQRVPVELDALLRRHSSMIAPELAQRGIEFELALGAPDAVVSADEDQLWQVILNLVRNAMEAMPEGGRLEIVTRDEGDGVSCTIADTGSGMAPEVVEQMFRPFFSTKRGGTGLGMPFVRQVLSEHESALHCLSAPDEGTRFTFVLKRVRPR